MICLLFPGQGSPYKGMGSKLMSRFPSTKRVFEEASDILHRNVAQICLDEEMDLSQGTHLNQIAIYIMGVASFHAYMTETNAAPSFMAGHSLGEYTAITCSGGISYADGLRLIDARGRYMEEVAASRTGSMAAVMGVPLSTVNNLCHEHSEQGVFVSVANYNSKEQYVIAGHTEALSTAARALEREGASVVPLKVPAPFHTVLMATAAERFATDLLEIKWRPTKWPVISNVTAKPYQEPEDIRFSLLRQMTRPVQWEQIMAYLVQAGADLFVEMGPKDVLTKLIRKSSWNADAFSFDNDQDLAELKDKLASRLCKSVPSTRSAGFVERCMAVAVSTINDNWDTQAYSEGVIESYKKLVEIQGAIERENRTVTHDETDTCLMLLERILVTKGVSAEEQIELKSQIECNV
ncbi:hypothetical protein C173_20386 [Paenibacillus sp. FSL R7-277]|uniref:ACP S-malonyltransferase n=1 Tax=unclassified Paenibacillus TaxID=185978 RepID=UPI0003E26689|nr:ACP S-malonyltransferase [Paenibacillus sp. FSL R7-277]ETT65423.1 hypothetical protein C173_20386 [Paenibacillus sp. FSL R7-277]